MNAEERAQAIIDAMGGLNPTQAEMDAVNDALEAKGAGIVIRPPKNNE